MKRAVLVVGLVAFLAAPAAAQWTGMPAWNSPKGGTGITISADYGRPNENGGKGNAFAGRASLGLGTVTVTAGVATWKPDETLSGVNESLVSYGGTVGFRLIGGTLLPIAVNFQAGASRSGQVASLTDTIPAVTTVTGAVGFSAPLPTPGFSVEPWFSPGIRYNKASGIGGDANFGFALGVNIGFGMMGAHLAYDRESLGAGASQGIFGVGAHVAIRMPLGM
jgi:hypothetical protein